MGFGQRRRNENADLNRWRGRRGFRHSYNSQNQSHLQRLTGDTERDTRNAKIVIIWL